MEHSDAAPVGIRQACRELPSLVDVAAGGSPILISRRGRPLAALISTADYERLQELERRDEGLQAVFRGQGIRIFPWTTPKILEVLTRLGAAS
jgi:prevent-host-death family protein